MPLTQAQFRVAFVCVQNAGRSQMATAFAERERERRDLEDAVEIHTGGTHPAEGVHDEVIETMAEEGIDVSDRTPRAISDDELATCDVVATMGCSTLTLDADTDVRDWALDDPDGQDPEDVRRIRTAVEANVRSLFEDLQARLDPAER